MSRLFESSDDEKDTGNEIDRQIAIIEQEKEISMVSIGEYRKLSERQSNEEQLVSHESVKSLDDCDSPEITIDKFGVFESLPSSPKGKIDFCKIVSAIAKGVESAKNIKSIVETDKSLNSIAMMTVFDVKRFIDKAVEIADSLAFMRKEKASRISSLREISKNTEYLNLSRAELNKRILFLKAHLKSKLSLPADALNSIARDVILNESPLPYIQNWAMSRLSKMAEVQKASILEIIKSNNSRYSKWLLTKEILSKVNKMLEKYTESSDFALKCCSDILQSELENNYFETRRKLESEKKRVEKLERELREERERRINAARKLKEARFQKMVSSSINFEAGGRERGCVSGSKRAVYFNEISESRTSSVLKFNEELLRLKDVKDKWFGFNLNSDLVSLMLLVTDDPSILSIDQQSCSKADYERALLVVDKICLMTRSKQGKISHIIYGKRFNNLVNGDYKDIRKKTYPSEIFSCELEQIIFLQNNIGGVRYILKHCKSSLDKISKILAREEIERHALEVKERKRIAKEKEKMRRNDKAFDDLFKKK